MKNGKDRMYLLQEETVPKALLTLGVPMMIGMMVSALYNLVDAYFVGRLGTSQIGAISVVYPIGVIVLGFALLFGSGAASYLSRLLGKKSYQEASECASTALLTSLVVGGFVIVLILFFLEPVLKILGATDTILPFAKEYAAIFIVGLVFNIFNITANNIFSAEGAAMLSMVAMFLGGATNIILDPLLIFGFDMGVKGAAVATLLSRILSAGIYLNYLLSGKSVFQCKVKNWKPSKKMYSEIVKIGVPMLVYHLLITLSMGITNSLASNYGDSVLAAFGVVTRITALGSMILLGFLKGYQPFVGYNFGAKRYERVEEATKTVLVWGTIFCVASAAISILFRTQIMQAFSKDDLMVVEVGSKILVANALVFIGMAYQTVYGTRFLALGKAKQGGMISLGRQGIFFIPLVFLLNAMLHLNGLILAQPLADICSILMVIIMVQSDKKEMVGETLLQS